MRQRFGHALFLAQQGQKHDAAKALKGFGDAAVLEVVEDFDRGAYRAVYTVRFVEAVYVLHIFQKKSKHGSDTPSRDINLIKSRLKRLREERKAQGR